MIQPVIAARPRKPRRDGRLGKPPGELRLYLPRERRLSRLDVVLSLGALAALASVFWAGGKFGRMVSDLVDEVQIVEEKPMPPPPPPPPPKDIKELPKPHASSPEPQASMLPKTATPPPPQFGIEKEGTSEKGDFAVAIGNTLMKKSDSLVRPPPTSQPQQLDQEPEALGKVLPKYPEWAEEQGVTSRVVVLVTVDAQGRVIQTEIQKSGGQDFNQAALAAAHSTLYKPYIEKGHALPARFAVVYEFVLQ